MTRRLAQLLKTGYEQLRACQEISVPFELGATLKKSDSRETVIS